MSLPIRIDPSVLLQVRLPRLPARSSTARGRVDRSVLPCRNRRHPFLRRLWWCPLGGRIAPPERDAFGDSISLTDCCRSVVAKNSQLLTISFFPFPYQVSISFATAVSLRNHTHALLLPSHCEMHHTHATNNKTTNYCTVEALRQFFFRRKPIQSHSFTHNDPFEASLKSCYS